MKALILDGWHRGQVWGIPEPLPVFRLIKPAGTTHCACPPDEELIFESGQEIIDYKLAARGVDLLLYSQKGDLLGPMSAGRDRVFEDWKPGPLYFNCRDLRAW